MSTAPGTTELAKTYRPADIEPRILERWLAAKAYHADPAAPGDAFSIVIPPPNVTAALHLGHALNNTLQDVLTRYHRMLGRNALWMPGTDHAGIATQTVVDKRLQAEGQPALKDYKKIEADGGNGREQFLSKVQAWKDEYEAFITNQLKEMGCSCDWDRQRFTMDPVCAAAVREAFFRLFKDGLIYRGKRLVNWDPVTQTALADDEVEMQDIDGNFYYMKYPVVRETASGSGEYTDTGETVTVATTRPETMLGDTAVAVNPSDPHRAKYVGQFVRLPIVGRVIPIVGDDYVVVPDPDSSDAKAKFASGFLKVTPAHDPNDYEIGQRHELGKINVMAPDASISLDHGWAKQEPQQQDNETLKPFLGLSREEARKAIVRWFKDHELMEDVRPYRHAVGHSYRSHVPVEPYLSDQWYVNVREEPASKRTGETVPGTDIPANALAGLALRAMAPDQRTLGEADAGDVVPDTAARTSSRSNNEPLTADSLINRVGDQPWEGLLRFYPDRYAKTFETWHANIRDWCISRQLWWGHRIPVWTFDPIGNAPAIDEEPDVYRATLEEHLNKYASLHDLPEDIFTVSVDLDKWRFFICCRDERGDALLENIDRHRAIAGFRKIGEGVKTVHPPVGENSEQLQTRRRIEAMARDIQQDPDVLDTWFSSALWPMSTMGWPNPAAFPDKFPGGADVLSKWNPTNVLCTAREIITLWVSRMVMFNLYLTEDDTEAANNITGKGQRLPFYDVFVHAMIQDGHGQKMSKSLGNGVDPTDIIHSHGSDAMRFTLAQMTTQTQDVRMPVDMICPHTGQTFEPKFTVTSGGHKVAAPIQECPGDPSKKIASSFGVASGQIQPSDDMPLARNTSNKFDAGRNFANKLWNAVRFALTNLEEATTAEDSNLKPQASNLSLPDRWILARLARTVTASSAALRHYEFSNYAQGLYDFFWRDLCDWYIEAVKPTVKDNPAQRQVLATCIDASLRLLHPVMPYITEALWDRLNQVVPERGVEGVELPASEMLVKAAWPKVDGALRDEDVEKQFDLVQQIVAAIRQVRTQYTVPPKQTVDLSAKAPAAIAQRLLERKPLIQVLANVTGREIGPRVEKPADAAVSVTGEIELYLHGLIDTATETTRLQKRAEELAKSIGALRGRLSNESYVSKAPAKLVQETRDQLAAAEREAESIQKQLETLG